MELDPAVCYAAIQGRDRRFEGRFVVGVVTTGIYCRPGCPARLPRPENTRFFACAAAAEDAGFRACLRCRPDRAVSASGLLARSDLVAQGLALLGEERGVAQIARRLGVDARHLRRAFARELGASPHAVLSTRRLHFARQLLEETDLPITAVAHAAGFASLRRFHGALRERLGVAPRALRTQERAGRAVPAQGLVLRLACKAPFDWPGMLAFLGPRATPHVEQVAGDVYRRTVLCEGRETIVEASHANGALLLRVPAAASGVLLPIVMRMRRFLDLDADPAVIDAQLASDPQLARLVRGRPGVRVPGAWDAFETAVRAILGQQVSVAAATTLAGRLVTAFGQPVAPAVARPGLTHRFPTALALAHAPLGEVGLPRARAAAIRALALAVHEQRLDLTRSHGLAPTVAALCALPGIGAWTAQYIAMRVHRECDAFPAGDLVLKLHAPRAERWRPWRAYAAMHLWLEHAQQRARIAANRTRPPGAAKATQ